MVSKTFRSLVAEDEWVCMHETLLIRSSSHLGIWSGGRIYVKGVGLPCKDGDSLRCVRHSRKLEKKPGGSPHVYSPYVFSFAEMKRANISQQQLL